MSTEAQLAVEFIQDKTLDNGVKWLTGQRTVMGEFDARSLSQGNAPYVKVLGYASEFPNLSRPLVVSATEEASFRGMVSGDGKVGFAPPTNDYIGIQVAISAAIVCGGGFVNLGATTYDIGANTLPLVSGVHYRGQGWTINGYAGIPDSEQIGSVTLGGTVVRNDGTVPVFAANITPRAQPYGSTQAAQAAFSAAGITNCGITGVAIKGGTYGIQLGADLEAGGFYNKFDNILIVGATRWGAWFENCLHNFYDRIYALGCGTAADTTVEAGGIKFRSSAYVTLFPSNSRIGEVLASAPANLLARGVEIEAVNGCTGGIYHAAMLQSNRFSDPAFTPQAGTYSGTASLAVTDSSKFTLDMPVYFTAVGATGASTTAAYFVTKIIDSTHIILSTRINGPDFLPTAGSVTITTKGFAPLAVYGRLTSQSFTATAGSDALTIGNSSTYRIGQKVIFKTVSGTATGFAADTCYYVVAQPSYGTIKLSATSGGAPITPGGSSTSTLTTQGDSASLGYGAQLDLEGGGTANLIIQAAFANCFYGLQGNTLGNSSRTFTDVVLRQSPYQYVEGGNNIRYDVDTNSAGSVVHGGIRSFVSRAMPFLGYDGGASKNALNLAHTLGAGGWSLVNQEPGNGDWTQPGRPLGVRAGYSATATQSINLASDLAGHGTYTGSGAGTWTFGQGLASSMKGFRQTFKNQGTGALTVTLGASDGTFDGMTGGTSSGKSFSLAAPTTTAAGGCITIVCAQIGASSYQWEIESLVNATLV